MIGVVLWSDSSDRKAVIWCEDQGDLAFLSTKDDAKQSDTFFDAGDVVQFDMEVEASMRRACNTRLVSEQTGAVLPDVLRYGAKSEGVGEQTARIIPFAPLKECKRAVYEWAAHEA